MEDEICLLLKLRKKKKILQVYLELLTEYLPYAISSEQTRKLIHPPTCPSCLQ